MVERSRVAIGADAEARAAEHLARLGYTILARNFRVRGGEIDLVARHRSVLCFVEVRARKSVRYGAPEETVSPTKRKRILLAARHWIARHGEPASCRFDVVAIVGDEIKVIPDAFRA